MSAYFRRMANTRLDSDERRQAIVDAAVASAQKSDIDTNATYAADIAMLKGTQLVTGWADLKALTDLAAKSQKLGGASSMFGLFTVT